MTLKQTEKLIQLLKASGVTRYKSVDLEVEFREPQGSHPQSLHTVVPKKKSASVKNSPATGADLLPKEAVIPHHMSEVRSLLRLDDESLVDKLFPEGPLPMHMRAE